MTRSRNDVCSRPRRLRDRFATGAAFIALLSPTASLAADCPADLDGNATVDGADLAYVLSGWGGRGAADLTGDGVVDGADLANILAAWGDCPVAACEGFTSLTFDARDVDLSSAGLPMTVTLDGSATASAFSQEGMILAILPTGEPIPMEFHPGVQKLFVGETVIDIAPFAPPGVVLVNGAPTPIPSLIGAFVGDLTSGMPIGAWAPTTKALLAMLALTSTPEWACNVEAALGVGGVAGGNQSGWCKFTAYSVATIIAGLAAAGCFALTGTCAAGTVVTLGGMAIPCTTLIGLCAGGSFAGTAAAYEAVLALWGD
jgi:hypothetical protein